MMIFFKEFTPDLPATLGGMQIANNCIPRGSFHGPLADFATYSDQVGDTIIAAVGVLDQSNNASVFAASRTKLYKLLGTTFIDVTRIVGGDYITSTDNTWAFEQYGPYLVATNYDDVPQVFTLGTSANFQDLAGMPPKAKVVGIINNFLVFGNTNDSSGPIINRIRWSAIDDITDWTPNVTTQSDFQNLENGNGGAITGIIGFGEYGIIFQERAITRMTYIGSPAVFRLDLIEKNKGADISSSIVSHGASIFYLGDTGFFEHSRDQSVSIGNDKIDQYFRTNFNNNFPLSLTAALDANNKIILWSYASKLSPSGIPDMALLYNWKTGQWTTAGLLPDGSGASLGIRFLFGTLSSAYTLEQLDLFSTNLDLLPYSLDSDVWKGGQVLLGGFNTNNQLGYFNSPISLPATFESNEISFVDSVRSSIDRVEPLVEGGVISAKIGYRNSLSNSVIYTTPTNQNPFSFCNIRSPNSFYNRVQIAINSGFTKAFGVNARTKVGGIR